MTQEPIVPLLPTLFFEDSTQEALASQMAFGWPSASLWSDEGGTALGSHGMQNNMTKFIALLNRLWDGKDFITHRKTSQSFTVSNRRLTVSLMMQPLLLDQMLARKDGISRHSGFMARSLMTYPESSMGTRHYQEQPNFMGSMNLFHDRITACLNQSLALDKKGCHEIPILSFSSSAKTLWIHFFNETETGLMKWERWLSIRDFASKAAENVARLAALFHVFQGKDGVIEAETIEQAIQIIQWHLFETRRILSPYPQSQDQQDASRLLQWMIEKRLTETTPQYLQQYSPIRDKKRRDQAIDTLIENHYLRRSKQIRKITLLINPKILMK